MASAIDRFLDAAALVGFTPDVRTMDQSTHTAQDAAAAVGCNIGAIVKSLIFLADDIPLLVLVSGPNRVDTQKLGAELGVTITKSDAAGVKASTGYSIGGVPPFGHSVPLRTLIDRDLLRHEELWAAAGSGTAVFPIAPQALETLTHGEIVAVN